MSDNYTRLADTLGADEGKVYATINGSNRELYEAQSIRAQIDLIVIERRIRGHKMTQHKVVGANGTGSCTRYFMNSDHLKKYMEYQKTGVFPPEKLQFINSDPQSTVGKQEVVLTNVIYGTIPVAALEESDDPITFDSNFTFDGIDGLDYFTAPANYR